MYSLQQTAITVRKMVNTMASSRKTVPITIGTMGRVQAVGTRKRVKGDLLLGSLLLSLYFVIHTYTQFILPIIATHISDKCCFYGMLWL